MEAVFKVQQFARCTDDSNKPSNFVGDWPVAGVVYEAVPCVNRYTNRPQIRIVGFHVEKPHGAFAIERFVSVAFVCLN